ncbi:hypothetical protein [Castellaniella sp. S9]|uniref:hypothetical protein n=1 Tax=Castellaniella sp. S9 TaxID=2993652 RepID=UPI0022B31606|nr:hypothetical protein [Castellaniella sp. S9]
MIWPAAAGVVTIIGIDGHTTGIGGHDAGIRENQRDRAAWSRSPESVVTIIGIRTVRFAEAVFALHVFQKKSKRGIETPKPDMDIIRLRLKAAAIVAQELRNE